MPNFTDDPKLQQPLSGSRRLTPSLPTNSISTPATASGCHPAEPAPATKHLTIEIDHKVPQLTGTGPLDARDTLAMPQYLWQDHPARVIARVQEQGAPTQWQRPAECLRCAGNASTSLAQDSCACRRLPARTVAFTTISQSPVFPVQLPCPVLSARSRHVLTS